MTYASFGEFGQAAVGRGPDHYPDIGLTVLEAVAVCASPVKAAAATLPT
jgi:hypothetical protein